MNRNAFKIPQRQPPVFLQCCVAVAFMWLIYVVGGFIVRGLIMAAGMLFLLLLAVSLSSTAAEARHHRHAHHAAIPMPRPNPVIRQSLETEIPQHVVMIRLYEYGLQRLASDPFLHEVRR
jgi:hypothetical protein